MTIDPAVVIAAFGVLVGGLGTAARMIYVDLRKDRDDWKTEARASAEHVRRLTRIIERDLKIEVPPAE